MSEKRKRGRPVGSGTGERKKTKNVTVDAGVLSELKSVREAIAAEIGFEPTVSQAIRRIIFSYRKEQATRARGVAHMAAMRARRQKEKRRR